MNQTMLDRAEAVLEQYVDEYPSLDVEDTEMSAWADPFTTEEKIIAAHEDVPGSLEPWAIAEITQTALSRIPPDFTTDDMDLLFDVVYDAISEALERSRD